MEKKLKKLLDNFITKPTEENLEEFNSQAKLYISHWIELMHSGKGVPGNLKKVTKNKTTYRTIEPKGFSIGKDDPDGYWYLKLQEKDDGVSEPFIVISIRSIFYSKKSSRNHNRRFYRMGIENWYSEWDVAIDNFIGIIDEGWLDYEDHRRNTDIKFEDQFIHSNALSREDKLSYLKDMVLPEEVFVGFDKTFFDEIDNLEFCIDAFAGDATKDSDGSNWRKILIMHKEYGHLTIRSTTTEKNYRPSKEIPGSDWRLDNSMPDFSPQAANVFWNQYIKFGVGDFKDLVEEGIELFKVTEEDQDTT